MLLLPCKVPPTDDAPKRASPGKQPRAAIHRTLTRWAGAMPSARSRRSAGEPGGRYSLPPSRKGASWLWKMAGVSG